MTARSVPMIREPRAQACILDSVEDRCKGLARTGTDSGQYCSACLRALAAGGCLNADAPAQTRRVASYQPRCEQKHIRPPTLISHSRSHSTDVFAYSVGRREHVPVISKSFHRRHESNAKYLRHEYQALLSIENQLGNELSDSVPHALLFLEENETLFTTYLEGATFSKLLRREANLLSGWVELLITKHLQLCSYRVGEWLHRFQESTSRSPSCHDHEAFMQRLCTELDLCITLGLPREFAGTLKLVMGDLSRSLAHTPVAAACVHGDFLPQNILIAGQSVRIVDFGSFLEAGSIYTDPCHFLGYLLILSKRPVYCRNALKEVAAHFLSGYHAPLHAGLRQLYTMAAVVRILLDSALIHSASALTVLEELLAGVKNKSYSLNLETNRR